MKLPKQTRAVERRTYNNNAVSIGAHASFNWGSLLPIAKGAIGGALNAI